MSSGFPTRSDTNQAVQKRDTGSKFQISQAAGFTIYVAKTMALISCSVTVQLICFFVFAFAKCRFSDDAAQFTSLRDVSVIR